jgi:uncharacterized membrane protein YedE/YeeE
MNLSLHLLVAAGGFVIGLIFGAAAERSGFCTMGAVSDALAVGNYARLRAWLLAIAVAIATSQGLHLAGLVDLDQSIYASNRLAWLGAIIGGVMFGYGMTQAGGCGSRLLVRCGAGSVKALLALLVLGVAGYAALRGILALPRGWIVDRPAIVLDRSQSLPSLLGGGGVMRVSIALAVVAGLVTVTLSDAAFRARRDLVIASLVIGAMVGAGWAVTGILGRDDFTPTPLASLTFVAPIGESIVWLMLASGIALSFGIGSTFGVIAGSHISARLAGRWRVEGFADLADIKRHLLGAALMGIGGTLALGCTIGQGLTGLSTLALGSVLAFVAILLGGALGVRHLEEGAWLPALRAFAADLRLRP